MSPAKGATGSGNKFATSSFRKCYTWFSCKRYYMIKDIEVFTKHLSSLLKYYGKAVDDVTLDAWFVVCNESLSDSEFLEACLLVRRKKDFIPPIDGFISLVRGDAERLAEFESGETWDRIMKLTEIAHSRSPEHKEARAAFFSVLQPQYDYALKKLGGLVALGLCPKVELHWKRKEFMDHVKLFREIASRDTRRTSDKVEQPAATLALPESHLQRIHVPLAGEEGDPEPVEVLRESRSIHSKGFSRLGDLT